MGKEAFFDAQIGLERKDYEGAGGLRAARCQKKNEPEDVLSGSAENLELSIGFRTGT
jgi:hypothetical protein